MLFQSIDDYRIPLEGQGLEPLSVYHWPGWLEVLQADEMMATLSRQLEWQEESIFLFNRKVKVPRLVCWYGDPRCEYTYSGVLHQPLPWHPLLQTLRQKLANELGFEFNSVLGNLYRTGDDGMGWHSDSEKELDPAFAIASLSFGQARKFHLRRKDKSKKVSLTLENGDLLVMNAGMQSLWEHSVPKSRQLMQPRINLTFRNILQN